MFSQKGSCEATALPICTAHDNTKYKQAPFLGIFGYRLSMSMYKNTLALLENEVVYHFLENIVWAQTHGYIVTAIW